MKKCCVPSCCNKDAPRHSIPANRDIKEIWLQRIGRRDLLEVPKTSISRYMVCEKHFADRCIEGPGKLLKYSLPTKNLPHFNEEPTKENCFHIPQRQQSRIITPQKLREALRGVRGQHGESFVTGKSPVLQVKKPIKVYGRRTKLFPETDVSGQREPSLDLLEPSTSFQTPMPTTVEMEGVQLASSEATGTQVRGEKRRRVVSVTSEAGLLSHANVTRQKHLSPDAKGLYKHMKIMQRRLHHHEVGKLRKNLKALNSKTGLLESLKNVNETTGNFFWSQQRNQKLKPRGRRYSVEDKVLALSIFKQSGKGYRYLSRIFSLPSRKTLNNLLRNVPLVPGINDHIFQQLKKTVGKLKNKDKYCVLMFDEVALETGLQYNASLDCFDGLVDLGGSERRATYADHALVFMLKGIYTKWKQPICFTFCENTMPTTDLVRLIKDVVRHVRQTGLHLVASISDQGSTNAAAIKTLLNDTEEYCTRQQVENRFQGYLVDGKEVVHLYDVPHLLKGIRNALLTSNLRFTQDGVEKEASWEHLMELYRLDQKMGTYSQCYKLTDEHILPQKIKKMKVKNCSQVFSHTVATAMKLRAMTSVDLDPSSEFYFNPEASHTADLFHFFDQLFDSVNGNQMKPPSAKELRGVVTQQSQHVSIWTSSISILKSMYFLNPKNPSKPIITPSLKNWIFTLHGFLYIWGKISDKFKYIPPRSFNQDPLENFFSCVRSHGVRNTRPNCSSFISSFKALLINNLVSPHSVGSNCEEDDSAGVLDTLKDFVREKKEIKKSDLPDVRTPTYPPISGQLERASSRQDVATPYVAGFAARKIRSKIQCADCKSLMETSDLPQNVLIGARESRNNPLVHPSSNFSKAFRHITLLVYDLLPKFITSYNVKNKIYNIIGSEDLPVLFCDQHKSEKQFFLNLTLNVALFSYLTKINNILMGKDLRFKDMDALTKLAYIKYSKKLHKPQTKVQ